MTTAIKSAVSNESAFFILPCHLITLSFRSYIVAVFKSVQPNACLKMTNKYFIAADEYFCERVAMVGHSNQSRITFLLEMTKYRLY